MTRLHTRLLIAAGLIAAGTTVAQAYDGRDIDRRQWNQDRRIESGIRDGSLNRREAERLTAEQRRIAELERAARRDGHISPREAAELRRAQRDASRHIWAERHDYEGRRYWNRGWGWGRGWY